MASVLKWYYFLKQEGQAGGESFDSVRRILCIFLISETSFPH